MSDNDSGFSSCIVCKTYQPLASAINAIEQQAIVAPCRIGFQAASAFAKHSPKGSLKRL
ncbi:hypothetical protein [Kingella oralis]